MVSAILKVLTVGGLLLSCACTKQHSDVITVDEMLRMHGPPVVIGSGFEIKIDSSQPPPIATASLYGVNRPVTTQTIKNLRPGQIAVYCDSTRFVEEVGFHFHDMNDPTQYSGQSLVSALFVNGFKLTIFRITDGGSARLEYSNSVTRIYLEVGDKDHLIRVRPLSEAPFPRPMETRERPRPNFFDSPKNDSPSPTPPDSP